MQIVIDIPEEEYERMKAYTGPMAWAEYLIVKGTPLPENATNGDMIKVIFPNCRVFEGDSMSSITIDGSPKIFRNSWWNAPYRAESEE